ENSNGQQVSKAEFPVRVQVSKLAGTYEIDSGSVRVIVRTNTRRGFQQVTQQAKAPNITVKPLPAPPADYSGAVGEFEITSKLVPEVTSVGEPITWTVVLEGTGNWNDVIQMPTRGVPEGFEVIQPKSNTEMAGDSPFIGELTEDVVLIPLQEGTFTIPGIAFIYFDTQSGQYRTISTPDKEVKVEPAKSSVLAPGEPVDSDATGLDTPSLISPLLPFDEQPQLPREPLNQSISSSRPMTLPMWAIGLLLPWGMVLIYWCWLAWKQVVLRDTSSSRRDARKRLLRWKASTDIEKLTPMELREWQREVEQLWQVKRPGPNAERLLQTINQYGGDGVEWVWLWTSCEDVLFGTEEVLPSEWGRRFTAALKAVQLPRVNAEGFLKPQVWIPVLLCSFIISSVCAQEDEVDSLLPDAIEVYQSGEFQKSEAALRLKLEQDWGDSGAHHDLALALLQQERWDEAAAHASIAAIQSPGNDTILWDVRLLIERAGWNATTTGKFFDAKHVFNRLVSWRSVVFWQWLGLGVSLILAGMAVWRMTACYRKVSAGGLSFLSVAVLMLLLLLLSLFCVERWGLLRHPDTVIVVEEVEGRSIPSEVDQQTRPLPVGTVGFFKDKFLGWRKVMLPNREEVWVREREVLRVYQD
ncbi:MAG: BatD family protein, partial [Verrucomicrobiota bacterium]